MSRSSGASSSRQQQDDSSNDNLLSRLSSHLSPSQSSALLSSLAPSLLQPHILASSSFRAPSYLPPSHHGLGGPLGFGVASKRVLMGWGERKSLAELDALERVESLLALPVPDLAGSAAGAAGSRKALEAAAAGQAGAEKEDLVPLIAGFRATAPSAFAARTERRRRRAEVGQALLTSEGESLGLREAAERSRGLLGATEDEAPKQRDRRRKRKKEQQGEMPVTREELDTLRREEEEVGEDLRNVGVKRALLSSEITEVEARLASLTLIRENLRRGLLSLREEELLLSDERAGIAESVAHVSALLAARGESTTAGVTTVPAPAPPSSRRRKGPAFLPQEHDTLPPNVAFMSLPTSSSLLSIDFSAPYGYLVSSSARDQGATLWDLSTGLQVGSLGGHKGVRCLQVEGQVCVTGGKEGGVRVWDLERAEEVGVLGATAGVNGDTAEEEEEDVFGLKRGVDTITEEEEDDEDDGSGLLRERKGSKVRDSSAARPASEDEEGGPLLARLEGHSKPVSALYFDGSCLVTGSADKTLRQWDVSTGQCVLTMDILWAISHSAAAGGAPQTPGGNGGGGYESPITTPSSSPYRLLRRTSSSYAPLPSPTSTPLASSNSGYSPASTAGYFDSSAPFGGYDESLSFVGGLQFWGYALASGTGDGCVRMWDMRTGQAHRTLVGHTGPVMALGFDEWVLMSGSLDRSIRIWDLRTGGITDSIRFDNGVTDLQFDSRKIVAAAGEGGVKIFNRTTLQHSALTSNGHTGAVQKLRYQDRYLVSGGTEGTVRCWALP